LITEGRERFCLVHTGGVWLWFLVMLDRAGWITLSPRQADTCGAIYMPSGILAVFGWILFCCRDAIYRVQALVQDVPSGRDYRVPTM